MKNVLEISDRDIMNIHCENIEYHTGKIACLLEKPNKDEIIKNISHIRNSLKDFSQKSHWL